MKSKTKIIALAGILGVALIGGTFAYFTQTDGVTNRFHTGTYNTELVERFKPKDGENWEPGAKVNTEVLVQNTGDLPVVVRVKFTEEWAHKSDPENPYYKVDTADTAVKPAAPGTTARNKFESIYQTDANDGIAGTDVDDSIVTKELNLSEADKWVYNPADGYYYYKEILPARTDDSQPYPETEKILESVTLDDNVDLGAYRVMKYYSTVESETKPGVKDKDAWTLFDYDENGEFISTREMSRRLEERNPPEFIYFMKSEDELIEGRTGYSDSDYTLTITAQTVQATDGAVKELWKVTEEDMKALGCSWMLRKEGELYSGDEVAAMAAE